MASGSEGTQTAAIQGVCIAFAIVSVSAICLRLYGRIHVARAIGLDDVLILCAAVLAWVFIAITLIAEHYGMGHHIETVSKTDFPTYLKVVWLGSLFYNACLGCIKASVLALYARLGDPALRRLSLIMIGVIAAQTISSVLTCIFQCNPVNGVWDPMVAKMACVNISAFYLANAALNILTDFLTYTLPLRLVWQLQMPRRQKTGVALMLCLGLFACISSIIRITFVPRLLSSQDPTYAIAPAQYWSVIETNIGILAASIPSFKAVANRYLPRLLNTASYNSAPSSRIKSTNGWGRNGYSKGGSKNNNGSGNESGGSKNSDGGEDGLSGASTLWGNNGFGRLEGKTVADAEVLGLPIQGPTMMASRGGGGGGGGGHHARFGNNSVSSHKQHQYNNNNNNNNHHGWNNIETGGSGGGGVSGTNDNVVPKPLRPRIGTVIESRYPGAGEGGRGSAEGGSEEMIVPPEGEIVKQTMIMRHVSGESYRDGSLF
ncbi:MAG: hypothetical protein M1812_000580 [Candelaria pacifica]|nr:MAG: hypothetical protein M1812_000580 [Candelaria pacifica]